jgi:GTPase SAR1 family protein
MGPCLSTMSAAEVELARKSRMLEKMMQQQAQKDQERVKLLILGAGESGKSTLFKQMKVLYGKPPTGAERRAQRGQIHANVLSSVQALLRQLDLVRAENMLRTATKPTIATEGKKNSNDSTASSSSSSSSYGAAFDAARARVEELRVYDKLTPEIAHDISELWQHDAIQHVFDQRHNFQLPGCTSYFMSKLDEIASDDYVPTNEDLLRVRVRTSGIVEEKYTIDGMQFSMYDVGGQRNERKKWIHCFENVTAIIFVAAISEYDQVLFEDHTQNRVVEAIELFGEICSSAWFTNTSIVLFLNKVDLFQAKVPVRKIEDNPLFADCTAGHDVQKGIEYMTNRFLDVLSPERRADMYCKATCATDTSNVKFVFGSCLSIITQSNLSDSGFM